MYIFIDSTLHVHVHVQVHVYNVYGLMQHVHVDM